MIAIVHNLELKWPYYVSTFLSLTGNIASVSTQLISLECLITDYGLEINALYLKFIATISIYFGFLIIAFSILMLKKYLTSKKTNIKNQFIIIAIVVSIMIQPNSLKEISDIYNCQKIEDKSYLNSEMSVECYTQDHYTWV